jgi:hypothetical protein
MNCLNIHCPCNHFVQLIDKCLQNCHLDKGFCDKVKFRARVASHFKLINS